VIERIEKTNRPTDPWKITAAKETKEDKKRDQQSSTSQEERDSFGETSDFIQLLTKDPKKFKTDKIESGQIAGLIFRGVSTHREKALLEVDISLHSGLLIQGAQIALSRQEGMQYLSRKPGDNLVVEQIVKGTFLTVAVPQKEHESAPSPHSQPSQAMSQPPVIENLKSWNWSYYLGLAAMGVALLLLIYFFTI
jgi:hypothetical protein